MKKTKHIKTGSTKNSVVKNGIDLGVDFLKDIELFRKEIDQYYKQRKPSLLFGGAEQLRPRFKILFWICICFAVWFLLATIGGVYQVAGHWNIKCIFLILTCIFSLMSVIMYNYVYSVGSNNINERDVWVEKKLKQTHIMTFIYCILFTALILITPTPKGFIFVALFFAIFSGTLLFLIYKPTNVLNKWWTNTGSLAVFAGTVSFPFMLFWPAGYACIIGILWSLFWNFMRERSGDPIDVVQKYILYSANPKKLFKGLANSLNFKYDTDNDEEVLNTVEMYIDKKRISDLKALNEHILLYYSVKRSFKYSSKIKMLIIALIFSVLGVFGEKLTEETAWVKLKEYTCLKWSILCSPVTK